MLGSWTCMCAASLNCPWKTSSGTWITLCHASGESNMLQIMCWSQDCEHVFFFYANRNCSRYTIACPNSSQNGSKWWPTSRIEVHWRHAHSLSIICCMYCYACFWSFWIWHVLDSSKLDLWCSSRKWHSGVVHTSTPQDISHHLLTGCAYYDQVYAVCLQQRVAIICNASRKASSSQCIFQFGL